jgi:hypothetical protein
MAEEYIKAKDIPGFAEFPAQLQKLLSIASEGFLFQKDSPVYSSSYLVGKYYRNYIFYSEKCLVILKTLDTKQPTYQDIKSIDIDFFKCFGHKKGAGRKLLCYALTWIKEELSLTRDTVVILEADPTYRNNVQNAVNKAHQAENEDEAERLEVAAMKSLKAYYARYGFKGKGTHMEAPLNTILGKCQSGGTRKKRRSVRSFKSKA